MRLWFVISWRFVLLQQSFKVVDGILHGQSTFELALQLVQLLLQQLSSAVDVLIVLGEMVYECSPCNLRPIGEQASLLWVKVVKVLQYLRHSV